MRSGSQLRSGGGSNPLGRISLSVRHIPSASTTYPDGFVAIATVIVSRMIIFATATIRAGANTVFFVSKTIVVVMMLIGFGADVIIFITATIVQMTKKIRFVTKQICFERQESTDKSAESPSVRRSLSAS